jgi:hypothetical protein
MPGRTDRRHAGLGSGSKVSFEEMSYAAATAPGNLLERRFWPISA